VLCSTNLYHNSTHAADVVQVVVYLIVTDKLDQRFTRLEQLAMILAAVIHDVGHPGVTNAHLRARKVRHFCLTLSDVTAIVFPALSLTNHVNTAYEMCI
jgi:hypothetical protein